MKITLRELKQLIRESVQGQMQQEGLMDKLENLAAGVGLTEPSPSHLAKYVLNDFVKNQSENFLNTSIIRHWLTDAGKKEKMENFSNKPSIDTLKLMYPEPWDSPLEITADDLKGPYPDLAKKEGAIEKFLASNPDFSKKTWENLAPLLVPVFKKLVDRALESGSKLQTENITNKFVPPVMEAAKKNNKTSRLNESVQAMVREEIKRQLRSKR